MKKYLLIINNYLVPFKVITIRYNALMPAFFRNLETLLTHAFWYAQQLVFRFFFYIFNCSKTLCFHYWLQFWRKSQRKPSPLNSVVEVWLRFSFWPKTYTQASMCELVRYHGVKSMIGFYTILCISDEMLFIPYWLYELVERIHIAPCTLTNTSNK